MTSETAKRTGAILALLLAAACATRAGQDEDSALACGRDHVVVFGFAVSPEGKLAKFELYPPKDAVPNCPPSAVQISRAWKKTACAVFSMKTHAPTYRTGEEPKLLYSYYVYDAQRPTRLEPGPDAGSSPDNPVVRVDDSILDKQGDGVCDGELDATAPPGLRGAQ